MGGGLVLIYCINILITSGKISLELSQEVTRKTAQTLLYVSDLFIYVVAKAI